MDEVDDVPARGAVDDVAEGAGQDQGEPDVLGAGGALPGDEPGHEDGEQRERGGGEQDAGRPGDAEGARFSPPAGREALAAILVA